MTWKRTKLLIVTVFFVVSGSFALYRWLGHRKHPPKPDTAAFVVEFPEGWEARNVRENLLVAISPLDGPEDHVRENMTVGVERVSESTTVAAYLQYHMDEAAKRMRDAEPGEIQPTTLADRAAQAVEMTYTVRAAMPPTDPSQPPADLTPPQMRMRVWVLVTVDDQQRGYAIAATAPDETFEDLRETFQNTIDSFEIVESPPESNED